MCWLCHFRERQFALEDAAERSGADEGDEAISEAGSEPGRTVRLDAASCAAGRSGGSADDNQVSSD